MKSDIQPKGLGYFGIRNDYNRYRSEGCKPASKILLCQGFWALCEYRIGNAATRIRHPLVRSICGKVFVLTQKIMHILTGIHIPRTCSLGRSIYIPHSGPIFIGEAVTIGDGCTIHPGAVIGSAGRGSRRGCPTLGECVFVGVNAIIIGQVTIGDHSAIGAGAVVTKDVKAGSVMVGNPARCISLAGSWDLIRSRSEP